MFLSAKELQKLKARFIQEDPKWNINDEFVKYSHKKAGAWPAEDRGVSLL